MSESSESSCGYRSSQSQRSTKSSRVEYVYQPRQENSVPNNKNSKKSISNEEFKNSIGKIKEILKQIESSISNDLSLRDKFIFEETFRNIVVDNEEQVICCPTVDFFISKYQSLSENIIDKNLKDKVLKILYEQKEEEKKENSQLKYW